MAGPSSDTCPCRSAKDAKPYAECCEPYHAGRAVPPTAEALMRSRYSAYARGDAHYIQATWHHSKRPASAGLVMGQVWTGLKIVATHEAGDEATVEFVARSTVGGRPQKLHEVSRFKRELGRWVYVEGLIL